MALNQTTLITEIANQMVRTDLDTRIAIWLNWGLTRIDRFADLKGLGKHVKAACVVGQTEYAFPTDLKYVRTFRQMDHIMTTFAYTAVVIATGIITLDENIATGTRVIFLNSDPPGGVTTGTAYYAINVSSTTIKLATTTVLAAAGTAMTLTDQGSGTHVLEIFNSTSSRILEYIPEKDFDTEVPDPTTLSTGKAEGYVDKADIFELTTPPNARYVMDIRYIKWQDELGTGETPEVSKIDDLIVAASVVEGWHALGELKMRDAAQTYFLNLLGSHKAVDRIRPDYAPKGKGYSSQGVRGWNMSAESYQYPFMVR